MTTNMANIIICLVRSELPAEIRLKVFTFGREKSYVLCAIYNIRMVVAAGKFLLFM